MNTTRVAILVRDALDVVNPDPPIEVQKTGFVSTKSPSVAEFTVTVNGRTYDVTVKGRS